MGLPKFEPEIKRRQVQHDQIWWFQLINEYEQLTKKSILTEIDGCKHDGTSEKSKEKIPVWPNMMVMRSENVY